MKYNHSFANYPTDFKGCVVSPTKICLQFLNPQIKLRVDPETRDELPKMPDTNRYLCVPENGVDINTTAVGCQMPIVEKYQFELLDAYKKYYRLYSNTYKETYKKDFIDFIKQLHTRCTILLNEMEK